MPYPFKNPVSPIYQDLMESNIDDPSEDLMGSNIGVPSEDLIDFDKTDKAVNASSRLSEIDAEIARLKQRIAEKRAVENAYNRPASVYDYIIGGDRSGLDRIAQQKMTEELATINRIGQDESKLDTVRKELNNLIITKETLDAQGKDSRLVTAQIQDIYAKYPDLKSNITSEYDPRNSEDYILADVSSVNSKDNSATEIEEAIAKITDKQFTSPSSIKELNRLDKEFSKRKKYDEYKANEQKLVNEYNGGEASDGLVNLGYEVKLIPNGYKLMKGDKVIKTINKKSDKPSKGKWD